MIAVSTPFDVAEAHREYGRLTLAAVAYREAVELAEAAGDTHLLGLAFAGLARTCFGDDPAAAEALAARALETSGSTQVLLAAGWVGLGRGNPGDAADLAARASVSAQAERNLPAVAESSELLAAARASDRMRYLQRSAAVWTELADPVGIARTRLAMARLRAEPDDEAAARLAALGVDSRNHQGAGLLSLLPVPPRITVCVLGGFRVLRDGRPVTPEEWQSRKARDLLKILVARRGRPITREALVECLWPDDDPARCANRLSVALSIVRAILDPDRRLAPDHYVAADRRAVRTANLAVDAEEFLIAAQHALSGDGDMAAAERRYAGDFLEDESYADWATDFREELRAAYLELLRTLATSLATEGRHDRAVRYGLRLLAFDAFDEQAHRQLVSTLVAAGRHGEARRRHRIYVERMAEIGVRPTPFGVATAASV